MAARLDGVDGRVATYGFSYPGATQLLAATERPPSLVAICPGIASSQYWEGWTYQGGALHLAFAANWAAGLAAYTAIGHRDGPEITRLEGVSGSADWFSHLPLLEPPGLRREDAPYYFDWIEHSAYDGYWHATAIDEDYARIQVPGLHVGGWYDVFLSGSVANFRGLAGRQKLLVGPWQHGPWIPLLEGGEDAAALAVNDWQLRFLDEVVKGRPSGVFDAPATVYVMGDGWRDLDGWPPSARRRSTGTCAREVVRTRSTVTGRSPPSHPATSRRTCSSTTPSPRSRARAATPAATTPSRRWARTRSTGRSAGATRSSTRRRRSRPTST